MAFFVAGKTSISINKAVLFTMIPNALQSSPKPQAWQIGDLVSIGSKGEARLIVNVTATFFEVIAKSGWYNRYPIPLDLPIRLLGQSGLSYAYKDREQLFRDYLSGSFTRFFNA